MRSGSRTKITFGAKLICGAIFFFSMGFCLSSLAADSFTAMRHLGKYPTYPKVDYGTGKKAQEIKKGEYLAKAGDCIACHTDSDHGGKPFAGGLGIKTPFGTIYTPNITPDKATGVGKWTFKDFKKAMTEGISPKGYNYYPAFPYVYFSKLTDADLRAIWAYIQALPPVKQKDKPLDMKWPFSWRFTVKFWNILFFDPYKGTYKPNPHESEQWNRGAYLVEGLGHCAMCHTPLNFMGAPKRKYNLTGNFVEGYYAPNITSTHLDKATVTEIVDVFLENRLVGGGYVQGPMLEVNHDSLHYLSVQDLDAIATYLKTVKSKTPPKPKHKKASGPGAAVYENHCDACHGVGAGGAPKFGDAADWAPFIKQGLNVMYQRAITGYKGMPPKGMCSNCTDAQIQAAVEYMVDNSKPGAAAPGAVPKGPPPPKYTLADGKKFYQQYCAVCHNTGWQGAPEIGDKLIWSPLIKQNMDVLFEKTIMSHSKLPGCAKCDNTAIMEAAIKYIVEQSKTQGNYQLW